MGRKSHSRSLSVWSNGERVGTWTIPARGETQFLYEKAWTASAVGRPLSLSLPYTGDQALRGDVVRGFFDNLLPDSETIRKRLAAHYRLASIDAFDLLQEIGRDCVGAVQLLKEDFCQALGVPPHLKYESDGGPGLSDLAAVLRGSERADEDLTTLLTSQVLFWLMAAPDGHAKNFSIRLLPAGRYALTPLYDVMSIWPIEGGAANQYSLHEAKLAMAVLGKNKHYRFSDEQRRHFNSTAARCFMRDDAEEVIERVLARTNGAIDAVCARLPTGFPEQVAASIFDGIARSARQLGAMSRT